MIAIVATLPKIEFHITNLA